MRRGYIQAHNIMDDRKKIHTNNHSSEKCNNQTMLQKGKSEKEPCIESRSTSNPQKGRKRHLPKMKEYKNIILRIFSFLKRLYTTAKLKKAESSRYSWIKGIVVTLFTLLVIPQLLNAYNVRKSEEAALQSTIQQIYINYEAGNYSEAQQDIYNVYPKLQKRKDYQILLDLSDILLYTTYQNFYSNHEQLTDGQKDLINLYANNALGYAEKLKDTTAYIKICIHVALFNISEYEFTLDANYLDKADGSLSVAGEYFDKTHDPFLTITDKSEADLACQFFNLKNLQYQVSYYRALIAYSFMCASDNTNQIDSSSSNTEHINPYDAFDMLSSTTTNFIANVHIIEDQNAKLGLIPEDTIKHMLIRAGVAYIESGNLLFDLGGMLPIFLTTDDSKTLGYCYSWVDICSVMFSALEKAAVDIKNYEDLVGY